MALFGKTFKLFLLPGFTTGSPSDAQIKAAIATRSYIRDIALYCPIVTVSPPSVIRSSIDYANNLGVLLPAAGSTLDSITDGWAIQGMFSYKALPDTSERYNNIVSLFPGVSAASASAAYLIWDESSAWALMMYEYGYTCTMVNVNTGEARGLYGGSSFAFRSFYQTWDKVLPSIHFFYNNRIYRYSIHNLNSSTANFRLTNDDSTAITNSVLASFWDGYSSDFRPPRKDTDPYSDIPASGPSTPSGTYDFTTSDKIDVPALPSLSAVSTGFVSLWSPTEAQMLQLSSFMWNANPLTIEFWKKIVADPMQLIYGLNIVPLDLDALGMIDSTGEVVVGLISTGVSMNHLSGQWVELDCGTVTLDETWSAYLDYDPYTKLEIYLPYCGTHPLRVDDFMPGTVKLTYHIDLLSGACVAILTATKSDKHGDTLDSVVYQFMGNCAAQIPVTASQYADAVRSVIQLAASIGTMIAGAAGAGAAVAAETSALPASAGLAISSGAHQASAMVENVMGIKPNVERSGAIGATGGLLSVQTPYLILTRPRQARPKNQNTYTGYPSFITETLGDLEGWTQIQAIHLEGVPCTADELSEIDELLKSGVIF